MRYRTTGENVRYAIEGNELVIRLKLDHRHDVPNEDGSAKKTIRVASTLGNQELAPGVYVGVTAFEWRAKK